ncbi:MAG TPA: cupin domain-containing protein [Acidimicrobiia bacterium]|jgi:hypothetical protein|nr:cupin domain-containing protein [Acidimicrobiia bacterium]
MDDTATQSTDQDLRPFFYDIAQLPGYTIEEMAGDGEGAQEMYDLFGRELVTKTILMSPKLSVFHESAKPGERVKPHRHGTHQLTYVLRGELIYGNQRTGAGMGYFSPDALYSWRAGDEGAEWIEIHAGEPGIFSDRPES